jgi:hypothetical protein
MSLKMSGCRPLCSLCDAIGNFIVFYDFSSRRRLRSGVAKDVVSLTGGTRRIARFVDSSFILNTEADREPRWATGDSPWLCHRELAQHVIGLTFEARRHAGLEEIVYSATLCDRSECAVIWGLRDVHVPALCAGCVIAARRSRLTVILEMVPAPLLVLDTRLRSYPSMSRRTGAACSLAPAYRWPAVPRWVMASLSPWPTVALVLLRV